MLENNKIKNNFPTSQTGAGDEKFHYNHGAGYQKVNYNQGAFNMEFKISPDSLCQNDVFLVIAVCSAVQRVNFRNAIRETWGTFAQKRHLPIKIVFILGLPQESYPEFQSVINAENSKHGDIIQLNLVDNPSNLSLKTLGVFQWMNTFCTNSQFLMKTDDDLYINFPALLRKVKDIPPRSKVILGHMIQGARPITNRNDPWYNPPGFYKNRTYPNYVSGSAYVFPTFLTSALLEQSRKIPVFWLEDIFITGILARKANISLVNSDGFLYMKPSTVLDYCSYKTAEVIHGFSTEEIIKFWKFSHVANC